METEIICLVVLVTLLKRAYTDGAFMYTSPLLFPLLEHYSDYSEHYSPRQPLWTGGLFVVVHVIKTHFTANQNWFSPTFVSQTQDPE